MSGPPRVIRRVAVGVGPDAVDDLLPALRDALSGSGPVVRPQTVRPGDSTGAREIHPELAPDPDLTLGPDEDSPDDPTAVVVATSGSTGEPKPALLSASALFASAAATHDRLGGPGVWLLGVPGHTVAGVMVCVRSLVARTTPVVVDLGRGFDSDTFTRAARRHEALAGGRRRYAALVPTQLGRLLAGPTAGVTALAALDAVLIGGAGLAPGLRSRADAAGIRVVSTYGSSETAGGCVYDGVPLDGVQVDITSEGRIVIGGAHVARGYLGRPGHPAFHADPDGTRHFVTDDAGEWVQDRLRVVGRVDDMIVTGGFKVSPRAVEDVLGAQAGVVEAVVVGVTDEEWGQRVIAAVVASPDVTLDPLTRTAATARWRSAVTTALGRWAAPDIHLVSDLPLMGPGKPDRQAVLASMTAREADRMGHAIPTRGDGARSGKGQ